MSLADRIRPAVARSRRSYPVHLWQAFANSHAGNFAAGLAFNAFMSMFPLLLGVLALVGVAAGSGERRTQFEKALLGFFPEDAHTALTATLNGVHEHAGLLGAVGFLGMLFGGGNLFTSMEFALGKIFGARQRDFLRQRLMALVMTSLFALAIVAVVSVNAALALTSSLAYLGAAVPTAVWIGFMLAVYRFVPNRTFAMADLWPGALLSGLLMEALSLLWPLYAGLSRGFTSYGATFALFFLLATWLYFWSQFVLLGAVANRLCLGPPRCKGIVASPGDVVVETDATRAIAAEQIRRREGPLQPPRVR